MLACDDIRLLYGVDGVTLVYRWPGVAKLRSKCDNITQERVQGAQGARIVGKQSRPFVRHKRRR
jgi:hypothetical protein